MGQGSFGWNLTREMPSNNSPYYPEVIYGKKPFELSSTTSQLPVAVNSITSLEVSLAASMVPYRKYNLAFDLWITNNMRSSSVDITHEIMIWLMWSPDLAPTTQWGHWISDGYNTYYHIAYKSSRPGGFHVFSLKTPGIPSKINILALLGDIQNLGYLASIEFGNEVYSGTGRTDVSEYSIHIETNPSPLTTTGFGLVLNSNTNMQNIYKAGSSTCNWVRALPAFLVKTGAS
jgi:hypothetical protein